MTENRISRAVVLVAAGLLACSASADTDTAGALPPRGDTLVAGTPYDATGHIPCSMDGGQPTGSCPFGVTREDGGSGVVTVTKPDGRSRAMFFDKGQAIGYDIREADPGEFSAERQSDLSIIHIGRERYEIPDAVIFGG